MRTRKLRAILGLLAFTLGLTLVSSSLLFPWVSMDLELTGRVFVRKGYEVAPYAPILAVAIALSGVVHSRVHGNRDVSLVALLVAGVGIVLFAAFVGERLEQRDMEFFDLQDIQVRVVNLSVGFTMFIAGGMLFFVAAYAEYASGHDPERRRKRRHG
ncbi:MAG: hypothetical protein RDV41_03805 [Planctomycetota bacterium]|nr:hypothetical protein [Planctomycetota bacterium]